MTIIAKIKGTQHSATVFLHIHAKINEKHCTIVDSSFYEQKQPKTTTFFLVVKTGRASFSREK